MYVMYVMYVCMYVCMYVYIQYNHKYISCVCFLGTPGIRSLWGSLHPLWPLWRDDESYWMLQKKGSHRGNKLTLGIEHTQILSGHGERFYE